MTTRKQARHMRGKVIQHVGAFRVRQVVNTQVHVVRGITVHHEFDDLGNHRITVNTKSSEWANYHTPTILKYHEGSICATTEYFLGVFPRVFMFFV